LERATKLASFCNPLEALNVVQISSLPDPLPSLPALSTGPSNRLAPHHLLLLHPTTPTQHYETVPLQFTPVSSIKKISHSLNSIGNILEKGFKVELERGV